MTNLDELAREFNLTASKSSLERIAGVAQSADLVKPGYLFVAMQGAKHHGIDFAHQAIANGAVGILTDPTGAAKASEIPLPILQHFDPIQILGEICQRIFDLEGLRLFAVTGTNGKTSTASYLCWLLNKMGTPTGLSASTQRIVGGHTFSSNLTTPQVAELYELLSNMKQAGDKAAVVEVSAQALIRHRVDGLRFEVAGFSNLSRDHLDDFGDMNAYLEAKSILFKKHSDISVINIEDEFGRELFESLKTKKYSIGDESTDWKFTVSESSPANLEILLSNQRVSAEVPAGGLMAKNLALAIAMAFAAGFTHLQISKAVENVDLVIPGRLQRVSEKKPAVFVDYAHTPAGVRAAVSQIRNSYPFLTVLLGASGNRDRGKRSEMAEACESADLLVITDQHPRDEDPATIRKTLLDAAAKVFSEGQVFEKSDPRQAIEFAVQKTPESGAVLWCGPGHLSYREIAGQKIPFSAIEIAREILEGKS